MSTRETVQAIKAEFPGFDRPLLVKVDNPDRYGIHLVKRAQELRDGKAAPEPRKHDKHGAPCRLYCRTTKTLYTAVHRAQKQLGHRYVADTVIYLIREGLKAIPQDKAGTYNAIEKERQKHAQRRAD